MTVLFIFYFFPQKHYFLCIFILKALLSHIIFDYTGTTFFLVVGITKLFFFLGLNFLA